MPDAKILTIYVGLNSQATRLVVHRHNAEGHDTYEVIKLRNLQELTRKLLVTLSSSHPDFMARLAKLDDDQWRKSKHRTRRYVAQHREHVYINSERLTDKKTEQLLGFWVATNVKRKEASTLSKLACEAAGVHRASVYGLKL